MKKEFIDAIDVLGAEAAKQGEMDLSSILATAKEADEQGKLAELAWDMLVLAYKKGYLKPETRRFVEKTVVKLTS